MDRHYDAITFILRRPGVAIFDDIKIVIAWFIKTIFKNSRKDKRLFIKLQSISAFLDIAKFADFR